MKVETTLGLSWGNGSCNDWEKCYGINLTAQILIKKLDLVVLKGFCQSLLITDFDGGTQNMDTWY